MATRPCKKITCFEDCRVESHFATLLQYEFSYYKYNRYHFKRWYGNDMSNSRIKLYNLYGTLDPSGLSLLSSLSRVYLYSLNIKQILVLILFIILYIPFFCHNLTTKMTTTKCCNKCCRIFNLKISATRQWVDLCITDCSRYALLSLNVHLIDFLEHFMIIFLSYKITRGLMLICLPKISIPYFCK